MLGTPRFAVRADSRPLRPLTVAMALLLAPEAGATAYQVFARTEAQAYHLRSWRGGDARPVLLPRRRLVQTLALHVYEVVSGRDVSFESSVRVWAEFGLPRADVQHLDGERNEDADLMKASLVLRDGALEGELGRQLYLDAVDLFAFDGARVRYLLPGGLGAELYAGLWVKGTSFLGSGRYQPDGTRESDARRLAAGVPLANPVLGELEPLLGGRLLLRTGPLRASLGYRRAMVSGKVDLERLVAQVDAGPFRGLTTFAAADLDLIQGAVGNARVEVRYDQPGFALSLEALRSSLLLSTDSIFYSFNHGPRDELRAGGELWALEAVRLHGRALLTRHGPPPQSCERCRPTDALQVGLNGGVAWSEGDWAAGADAVWRRAQGGAQVLVDLTAGYAPRLSPFSADARLSFARVRDPVDARLRGDFYGVQLAARHALSPLLRTTLTVEHNLNPFTRGDLKVFALVDFRGEQ